MDAIDRGADFCGAGMGRIAFRPDALSDPQIVRQKLLLDSLRAGCYSGGVTMTTTTGTIGTILHHKGAAVWNISPHATVFEAIQLLARKNIGALLVMEGDALVGMFSERDYTRKVALEGKTSQNTKVRDILSANVATIAPNDSVEEAMRRMTEKHIRHLPVVEDGRVVGLISIGDMVNWIISAQTATIDQLESYVSGR
jgi:CBS domain-containing protein